MGVLQEEPLSTISATRPKVTHGQNNVKQPEINQTYNIRFNRVKNGN
jgi:hypothetical protein